MQALRKLIGPSWLVVIAACGNATGPIPQSWDLEVGVAQVFAVESCDGAWFAGGESGVGMSDEFVWQVTLIDSENNTTVVDATDGFPDVTATPRTPEVALM